MPIVVERRKKTEAGKKVKGAAKSKPRPRKTRPNREEPPGANLEAAPPGPGKPEGPEAPETLDAGEAPPPLTPEAPSLLASTPSTPAPPDESDQAPHTLLPGELYQRTGRWWWRVKLPGEDQEKARPLKPDGEEAANGDRRSAERIAFEMWERAVAENAVRQIQRDSTDKVERLKAQFLDKVRHFTELVETANARIEAEVAARAEAEAKLAQLQMPAGIRGQDGLALGVPPSGGPVSLAAQPAPHSVNAEGKGRAGRFDPPEGGTPNTGETAPLPLETGACGCCGATGIALTCLKRIDSGQSLCPRCLAAFQADIARAAL